ncbi:MAG: hypothetical protein ACK4L7_12170, partial [Flavobacteriales bacterium]
QVNKRSWIWHWNESLWSIGGHRLGFEHMGRKVAFGKGLSDEEARRLVPILKEALRKARQQGQ